MRDLTVVRPAENHMSTDRSKQCRAAASIRRKRRPFGPGFAAAADSGVSRYRARYARDVIIQGVLDATPSNSYDDCNGAVLCCAAHRHSKPSRAPPITPTNHPGRLLLKGKHLSPSTQEEPVKGSMELSRGFQAVRASIGWLFHRTRNTAWPVCPIQSTANPTIVALPASRYANGRTRTLYIPSRSRNAIQRVKWVPR
ncbi:hypothetical protein GQ53DRAFT_134948 [Thozetella sp. PMI_491]|nr:hypothetical protein GQ53DRAFT_134948 [Thozetella sp. PMI_491]